MSRINSSFTKQSSKILCCYFNSTDQLQLIRVLNNNGYSLEKIMFPQQRFLFEAVPAGILEVHTTQKGQQILAEIYSCLNLQNNQPQAQLAVT